MEADSFVLPLFPVAMGVYNLGEEMHELNNQIIDDTFREKERDPNPELRSLSNGWQSQSNLRDHYESFDKLCEIVQEQCSHYLEDTGSNSDIVVPSCWANLLSKGGHNYPHNHNGNILSAVYYPVQKIVDGKRFFNYGSGNPITQHYHNGEGGELYFQTPSYIGTGWTQTIKESPYNIVHYSTFPTSGYLFIFPGYLVHGVSPVQTDCTRLSIAFQCFYRT